ncbi:DUF262 domain-containing protein [Mycoplasma iguanae]|uniref:DUF262 domain-containing protein n=1 Tax=Mycoplasma iguanae TaxID=292461 RepID=A0ABY5RBG2_9MOLU|nr:DUF262 domain-containing protein [Mycoplasma iguanae]UVD81550.1 DUF262 domain-containing protein [Mycoplasma iguanae]
MKYEFLSIKDIFNKYKIINIPYYQREYVWGQKNTGRNLYKFIDDIFQEYDKSPQKNYFIGTLAFCSAKVNDVIDGQQRITSLILILSVLAEKCSQERIDKHNKFLMPDGNFVLQEEYYLTEEIKSCLGFANNFRSQKHKADISKTLDNIRSQINNAWNDYQPNWYDGLYDYIFNHVKCISLEYTNISDSLKYFLNINSLSIELSQSDIFYSILSQALRISNSTHSIFAIKEKISELAENRGLNKDIPNYKVYGNGYNKGIDNIIYIFLNSYYQIDTNINYLNETGIGKWLSLYKNEVFNDQLVAKEFVNKFLSYIKDFEKIYKIFSNYETNLKLKSPIYTSWILLQYENYSDLLKFLTELFRNRHNYIEDRPTLYLPDTKEINYKELEEIAKRLTLTLIKNYTKSINKRLESFTSAITLDDNDINEYKSSIEDIIETIDVDSIFNLSYNDKKNVSKAKIEDQSRIIKVILALQSSLLNDVANDSKEFNDYLKNILLGENFSIEHLYSVQEYNDDKRLKNWQLKKKKFFHDEDFDTERFKFENLSLLNKSTNSSASDSEIIDKLSKYKLARKVLESEWEYLIQSFVEDSEFYKNEKIQSLGLPDRTLQNIDQNTWDLSKNNRDFNVKLLKSVIKFISKM